MKFVSSSGLFLALAATVSIASPSSPRISAEVLLDHVVAQLPVEPIQITGKLIVRRRRGIEVAVYGFDMTLHLGGNPPKASYTILDAFGTPIEALVITRNGNNAPEYKYLKGTELSPAPLSDLAQSIQKTDITWMDLTLSYLWWPGGSVTGEDSIKGIDCYVVRLPAPPKNTGPYSYIKLWIDKKRHMMLQAEGYNKDILLRRLWIKSCKKINDKWMIKDMEVQKYPAIHRTKLHVLDVNDEL